MSQGTRSVTGVFAINKNGRCPLYWSRDFSRLADCPLTHVQSIGYSLLEVLTQFGRISNLNPRSRIGSQGESKDPQRRGAGGPQFCYNSGRKGHRMWNNTFNVTFPSILQTAQSLSLIFLVLSSRKSPFRAETNSESPTGSSVLNQIG
jgi:hypothetical protein